MAIATSSKTNTAIAALAALGLSAAAGFGYWGIQNWNKFNSDYYKKGYAEETKQQPIEETPAVFEQATTTDMTTTTTDGSTPVPFEDTTTNATTTEQEPERNDQPTYSTTTQTIPKKDKPLY